MRLTSVAADGFKNLKAVQFSPSPHYNLIIGENAQGKTNLLEAIWMMTGCRSFRGTRERDYLCTDGSPLHVAIAFDDGRREQVLTCDRTSLKDRTLHRKTWHSSRKRRISGGSFSICRFLSCNRTVWSWCGGINSSYRTGMPSYGSL